MSSLNLGVAKSGLLPVSSPVADMVGQGRPEGAAATASFAALHAERVGAVSDMPHVPVVRHAKPSALDRPPTLGDAILSAMDRMGQSASAHWKQVPERAGPLEASIPSSASVFLKFQKGYGVESVVVPVRALVANGIPGLTQDRVAVVLVPAAGVEASGQGEALSKVLFMRVDRESAAALWTLLGVLGAVLMGGMGWGVRLLIRLRQDGVAL